MDPKLKKYLEGMEARANKQFSILDKKIDDKTSDVLEVIRNMNENISDQIGKIDLAHSYLRQHVDHVFKRIEYLEKKILK